MGCQSIIQHITINKSFIHLRSNVRQKCIEMSYQKINKEDGNSCEKFEISPIC